MLDTGVHFALSLSISILMAGETDLSMTTGIGLRDLLATTPTLGGKKSDVAYAVIKRAIILRTVAPGTLLREQELAREF